MTRRLVLAEHLPVDDVRARGAALGWEIGEPVTTDVSTETPIRSSDGERGFLYLEDRLIRAAYFRLDTPPIAPDSVQIAEHFPIVDREALLAIFATVDSADAAIDAISVASAWSGEAFDAVIFDVLDGAMRADEVEVRRFACIGATYAGWPELAVPLLRLLDHDADERVRRAALLALRGLNEVNWHDASVGARLERHGA